MNLEAKGHCTEGEMSLEKVAETANPKWGHKNAKMDNNNKSWAEKKDLLKN